MYRISKSFYISAAHKLNLPYNSNCKRLHGHNYKITVGLKSETLDNGMVVDFKHLSMIVDILIVKKFDHAYLNEIPPFDSKLNPTAENMAYYFFSLLSDEFKEKLDYVEVEETNGSVARYEE